MPQTQKQKNRLYDRRTQDAYAMVKKMAMDAGFMEHTRDGSGYDVFIKKLADGEIVVDVYTLHSERSIAAMKKES